MATPPSPTSRPQPITEDRSLPTPRQTPPMPKVSPPKQPKQLTG